MHVSYRHSTVPTNIIVLYHQLRGSSARRATWKRTESVAKHVKAILLLWSWFLQDAPWKMVGWDCA